MIYRVRLKSEGSLGRDELRANAAFAIRHGVPEIAFSEPHGRPLAVVGGGHSAVLAIDELRAWPGDIWAINGTCSWLARQGIASTLFSVDPNPDLADLLFGVERGILSSTCDPNVFEALKGRVWMFHPEHVEAEHRFGGGTTSATRAPQPALYMGYRDISFFGCEGNFAATTHTFKDEAPERQLLVAAGGERYRTTLQFLDQAESLATIISAFPDLLHDRSGGLLSAMIAHPDTWDVVGLTATLKRELDPGTPLVPLEA